MSNDPCSTGWSRPGPTGWPTASFGGKAQASEAKSLGKPASDQPAGARLGSGGAEELLSTHLNARFGTGVPAAAVGRTIPIDQIILSPYASVQVATPAFAVVAAAPAKTGVETAAAAPKPAAGDSTGGDAAEEYRALGRLAQAGRGGDGGGSASATRLDQDVAGPVQSQPAPAPSAGQATASHPPSSAPPPASPAPSEPAARPSGGATGR
jgi:hypothetical protein